MMTTVLLCFVLLFTSHLRADNIHKENSTGEFMATISNSATLIDIDHTLEIDLELTYPKTYQPMWKKLAPQLLSYDGFGISPFSLVSQKLEPQTPKTTSENLFSQKLTLILSPNIPGKHELTFYDITFAPVDKIEGGTIKIVSEIIPIEVTMPTSNFKPDLIIAPPMELTKELPITISTANKRQFIKNAQLASTEAANNVLLVKTKAIPWQFFAALLTFFIMLMVLKIKAYEKTDKI